MAQDYKWKFFYDSASHDINEILETAEEEISREDNPEDFIQEILLSELDENFGLPSVFFESQGVIFGLTENAFIANKLKKVH